MDSFYDAPRRAPMPTQIEKFLPAPVVPEVSIICTSKGPTNRFSSCNSWKTQQNRTENVSSILMSNGQNILRGTQKFGEGRFPSPQNTSQFLKKQVRFESPVLQQRPSLTYEPIAKRTVPENSNNVSPKEPHKCCDQTNVPQQGAWPLNGATFEQMYLSNIPNRNLDLSLVDLCKKPEVDNKQDGKHQEPIKLIDTGEKDPKKAQDGENMSEIKENLLPKTYREFLRTQKKIIKENKECNDSVTDIFNYKRKTFQKAEENARREVPKPLEVAYTSNSGNSKFDNDRNIRFHTENRQVQQPVYKNYPENSRQPNAENFLNNYGLSSKCNIDTQTSIDCPPPKPSEAVPNQEKISKTDSEPTNRDLLKIIAQQNEQLLILQKQVAMLLNREDQIQQKQIQAPVYPRPIPTYLGEKCITNTQNENFRNAIPDVNNTPKKQRGMSKFSIDLMTSFEVAIRPQHKQNFINHEPKIQEITESESGIAEAASAVDKCEKTLVDSSLHLQEPVKVREMCPSPEPSININMNDYDSSDDEEVSASEIGATFYHNLMGQVNNILRKAQVQTKSEFVDAQNSDNNLKGYTMNRVREATLKHLKNIGVTIEPIEEVTEKLSQLRDKKDYSETEISFAVKQLLMKYLPDEQLAKITCKQAQPTPFDKTVKQGIISNRPEFSFATVEYMKKYNLLANNKDTIPNRNTEQIPKKIITQKPEGPKILDITALKMQPKLL